MNYTFGWGSMCESCLNIYHVKFKIFCRIEKFYEDHPEITPEQKKSFAAMLDLHTMVGNAGESWFNVSVHHEDTECEGDHMMNWKERAYGTILDILMVCISSSE